MEPEIDFSSIKKIIMEFSASRGIPASELHQVWQADYELDWNGRLNDDVHRLVNEMELFQRALLEGDKITQLAALVIARGVAMGLQNFFLNIFEDIEKMAWSDDFKWPEIPENYKVPARYKHVRK